MSSSVVTFEHPLNARMRTLLRLEFLLGQAHHFLQGESRWDSRMFINSLMSMLELLSRADIKTDLIKGLERQAASLRRLAGVPQVDHMERERFEQQLGDLSRNFHAMRGQPGQCLLADDLLAAIRQRSTIPGGISDFDLPAYHLWLEQPADERRQAQRQWLEELRLLEDAVELSLSLIRNSAVPGDEVAVRGGLQRELDRTASYELIRVSVGSHHGVYPEVSGVKHRIAVRFLQRRANARPAQTDQDVPFQLTACIV